MPKKWTHWNTEGTSHIIYILGYPEIWLRMAMHISETVKGQALINLLTRGGLTGINSDGSILFVKAENFSLMIMSEPDIISSYNNCLANIEEEK